MNRVWVIGSGGMLGSAVARELLKRGFVLYRYSQALAWNQPDQIKEQLSYGVNEFFEGLTAGDQWQIYWSAGVGAMGSSKFDLEYETSILSHFLSLLRKQLSFKGPKGIIGFSSSSGAIYSGNLQFQINELSSPQPQADYGKEKLAQELLLNEFCASVSGVKLFIARFSTLYGVGQSFGKQQGLLSHIARCSLRHLPIEIYVPLDTQRDYLFVDDAANEFIDSVQGLMKQDFTLLIKIIASEQSVTISEIISIFNRIMMHRVRVIYCHKSISNSYTKRVLYRSIYPISEIKKSRRRSLLEGISILINAEKELYNKQPIGYKDD